LSLTPFAQEFPSPKDTQHVVQYHPHLMKGDLHPIRPFILFAIHLSYYSEVAARLFIKNGILIILGRLWVHNFRDPRGPGWRGVLVQNDMRVGCLLFLGGLARHYPSAREMADHLLQQIVKQAGRKSPPSLYLGGYGNTCHYKGLSNIACISCPVLPCAIPCLTLFFMETCLMHRVQIPETAHKYGEPWGEIMSILASTHTSDDYLKIKDAAARTMFALASIPEEHWQGFTESLYCQTIERCEAAFKFITTSFLFATSDPSAISQHNLEILQKMYTNAKTRQSEIVNPIDRFILLIRVRQAANGAQFSDMLTRSGFPELLTAVQDGRYDFLGDEPPSDFQLHSRKRVCSRMLSDMRFATEQVEKWKKPVAPPARYVIRPEPYWVPGSMITIRHPWKADQVMQYDEPKEDGRHTSCIGVNLSCK